MLVSFKQNCKYTNSVLLFVMEEVIFIFFVTSIFPLKKKKMQSLSLLIQFMLTHCLLNSFFTSNSHLLNLKHFRMGKQTIQSI